MARSFKNSYLRENIVDYRENSALLFITVQRLLKFAYAFPKPHCSLGGESMIPDIFAS